MIETPTNKTHIRVYVGGNCEKYITYAFNTISLLITVVYFVCYYSTRGSLKMAI